MNIFHFTIAQLNVASIWIDYVPSESNPADVPSRLHEMTTEEATSELATFGQRVRARIPSFADANGKWLSSKSIAQSVLSK